MKHLAYRRHLLVVGIEIGGVTRVGIWEIRGKVSELITMREGGERDGERQDKKDTFIMYLPKTPT